MLEKVEEKILLFFSVHKEYSQPKNLSVQTWDARKSISNIFEVFPNFVKQIKNKRVLDFGCGIGEQSAAFARYGAKEVLGLDTNEKSLIRARKLIEDLNLSTIVKFSPNIENQSWNNFDIIISQNSMEHFPEPIHTMNIMKSVLNKDGYLFITFGPPWFAPYGSHMNFFTKLPWVHILFSEKSVLNVRKRFRNDGAERYEDVESGLNRMSIKKFKNIIDQCELEVVYQKYDCVKDLDFLGKLPFLRELFVNRLNCILKHK